MTVGTRPGYECRFRGWVSGFREFLDVGGWGLGPKGSLGFRVLWSAGIEGFLGSSSGQREFSWFGGSRTMIKAQTQRYQTLSSTLATDALRLGRKNSLPGPVHGLYLFVGYLQVSNSSIEKNPTKHRPRS